MDKLLNALKLEYISNDHYRQSGGGLGGSMVLGRLFGGQLMGAAYVAATESLDTRQQQLHSLHTRFIMPGKTRTPIEYKVARNRVGHRFSFVAVEAVQDGVIIADVQLSFKMHDTKILLVKTKDTTRLLQPSELQTVNQLIAGALQPTTTQAKLHPIEENQLRRMEIQHPWHLDLRPLCPEGYLRYRMNATPSANRLQVWLQADKFFSSRQTFHQNSQTLQSALAVMVSDMFMARAALLPFDSTTSIQRCASLNHSVWFHQLPHGIDLCQWHLYDAKYIAGGTTSLVKGRLWTQGGALVLTAMQEVFVVVGASKKSNSAKL